jgi:hypothetical protein
VVRVQFSIDRDLHAAVRAAEVRVLMIGSLRYTLGLEVPVLQRVLVLVLLLYVVWRVVTAWGRRLRRESAGAESYSRFSSYRQRQRRREAAAQIRKPEELVECAQCGTYVPIRRVLTAGDGASYCSERCRERASVGSGV